MSFSLVYITSRPDPCLHWLFESIRRETKEAFPIIIVDGYTAEPRYWSLPSNARRVPVMPNTYQGKHRLTKSDYWAAATARNTGLCYVATPFVWYLDDRCVVLPGWRKLIQEAMDKMHMLCGAYEKRHGMTVTNGAITHGGIVSGTDSREAHVRENNLPMPFPCPGNWTFGCNYFLPVEWLLQINGQDEQTNSLGMDDVIMGLHLANNGFPIYYDPNFKIIEDRTPGHTGEVMKRFDVGVTPNDKSHELLNRLQGLKRSTTSYDLRVMRHSVLAGNKFPKPTGPTHDWYNNTPLGELPES